MVSRYKTAFNVIALWVIALLLGVFVSENTSWYDSLIKPENILPEDMSPLCWALLYTILAMSGLTLAQDKGPKKSRSKTLRLYYLLFISTVIWLPVTFKTQNIYFSFSWIILSDAIAITTLTAFIRHNVLAGIFLLPYIVWLIYATIVTHGILILNT